MTSLAIPTPVDIDTEFARIVDELTRRGLLGGGLGAAALLGLAGCGSSGSGSGQPSSPAPTTRTLQSAYGPAHLPADPQRVVAVDNSPLATCLDVGLTPIGTLSPADTSLAPSYEWAIPTLKTIGTTQVDPELVIALEPDLVIGSRFYIDNALYAKLSSVVPTYVPDLPRVAPPWQDVADAFANAVNRADRLTRVKEAYTSRFTGLATRYEEVFAKHTWESIYTYDSGWGREVPKGTGNGALDDLGVLAALGAKIPNATGTVDSNGGNWKTESLENLDVLADADVILCLRDIDPHVSRLASWRNLPAVKAGHVYSSSYLIANSYSIASAFLDLVETICRALEGQD